MPRLLRSFSSSPTAKFEVFQALWAMERRRPDGVEWGLDEKFQMIKAAGFDGIGIEYGTDELGTDDCPVSSRMELFKDHDLGLLITAFPKSIDDLRPYLEMAVEHDARFVNVIGQIMPLSVEGMIPVIRRWIAMGEEYGVELHFETHRACITNDFYATLQCLDAVPEMTMVADLSHYLVNREFEHPLSSRHASMVRRVLERSEHFQGRIASREQIQVPLGFKQHQKWEAQFEAWWREGFALWKARHGENPKKKLNFMCELGPPEYAMTDKDGWELSDRWEESQKIKDLVVRIWEEV